MCSALRVQTVLLEFVVAFVPLEEEENSLQLLSILTASSQYIISPSSECAVWCIHRSFCQSSKKNRKNLTKPVAAAETVLGEK